MALDPTYMNLKYKTHRPTVIESGLVFTTALLHANPPTRRESDSDHGFELAGTVAIPFFPLNMVTGPLSPAHLPHASLLPTGMWHPIADYIQPSLPHDTVSIWQQQLMQIKHNLQITTTDLACFLLVERPSVYQWFAGTMPRKRNLIRINALADLASDWASLELGSIRPYLDYRTANGECTIAELLVQQPMPSSAAKQLFRRLSQPPLQGHADLHPQVARSPLGTGS